MKISLPKEIQKGLAEKAKNANITVEAAATLILSEYVRIFGSEIYVGTWRSGDKAGKNGMRYVIDWPFQPGLVKISGDQSIDLEKEEIS
ncbi:MAG: hypothetical protein ACFE9D_07960 [Promethearchaeota archaeon]